MAKKEVIRSPNVPETGGPFNLCVRYGEWVYVSGLPPFDAEYCAKLRDARTNGTALPKFERKSIEDEATLVMNHLKWLLEAAGTSLEHLLKVTVWLQDQDEAHAFDRIYRSYFPDQETLPARTRMQAGRTPFDCGLEIDAIGYVPR